MKRKTVRATLLCLVVVALLAITAAPAKAIIGGQQDTTNNYSNVGVVSVIYQDEEGGEFWDLGGSCTLVRNDPGNVIVLTAAHCVDYVVGEGGVGIQNMRISFDPLLTHVGGTPLTGSYSIAKYEIHPVYLEALATTPRLANSKMFGIGLGREDVALLWLDTPRSRGFKDPPIPGLEPSQVIGEGGLAGVDLKSQTFTVAGYGFNGFVTGSIMSNAISVLWSGRNYKEVGVVSTEDLTGDRYLKLSECICFGDSGGPAFLGDTDTIASLAVWVGSARCRGPAYEYRLDTALAHDFLDLYLD